MVSNRRKKIILIGADLNRLFQIDLGITAKVRQVSDLSFLTIQTEREFDEILAQKHYHENPPLAIILDAYIVKRSGEQIYSFAELNAIVNAFGFKGPIIACNKYPVLNEELVTKGATHRADTRKTSITQEVDLNSIIADCVKIIQEELDKLETALA